MEQNEPPIDAAEMERRKLEVEEKKVAIEMEKIRLERVRAWTGSGSIVGSVLVVAATVCVGIWSQFQQGRLQHQLLDRQAKAQFELKAAEIVMSTGDPGVTLNKARALQNLFPQYLSENFAESFVPDAFTRTETVAVNSAPEPQNVIRSVAPGGIRQEFQSPERYGGNRPRVYATPRPNYIDTPLISDEQEPANVTTANGGTATQPAVRSNTNTPAGNTKGPKVNPYGPNTNTKP